MDVMETIKVNGRVEALAGSTVTALLGEMHIAPNARGVAVAINGLVVPRAAWTDTRLNPGDQVEIVRALQGG